jgi:hypothetical protein
MTRRLSFGDSHLGRRVSLTGSLCAYMRLSIVGVSSRPSVPQARPKPHGQADCAQPCGRHPLRASNPLGPGGHWHATGTRSQAIAKHLPTPGATALSRRRHGVESRMRLLLKSLLTGGLIDGEPELRAGFALIPPLSQGRLCGYSSKTLTSVRPVWTDPAGHAVQHQELERHRTQQ